MRTGVKIFLGIAGAVALVLAAVFYLTSEISGAGDDFFEAVQQGKMDRAYALLSDDFRAVTSQADMEAYLRKNGMERVAGTSWNSREMADGGKGNLTGTVTTADGRSIPVDIDLIKEKDQWKIYAIRSTAAPAGFSGTPKGLPDENRQIELVAATLAIFVDAVAEKDMVELHDHIARLWARQIDSAGLTKIYEPLFAVGNDAQIIKSMAPVFDAPTVLNDGIMVIKGHYPTTPSRFNFDLQYIYEGTSWRPAGISVNINPQ